jgi:Fe(3+) dicitrate transport protein
MLRLLYAVALLSVAIGAYSESGFIEEITIVGERSKEEQITGAAQYIDEAKLEEFAYTDIQRILRQVPGVSIQVEDGYGLRPNISIRGVATERSSRITLLEDNVLISPAPYSAPSAYYFPTAGRMHAIEILKGPAAITQGPYTIGGAMNLISTPIPAGHSGAVMAEAGEDATYRVHANYGATLANGFGFLLETHQWQSHGFQNIDRSAGHSGLDIEDYTAKVAWQTSDNRHRIELKMQYADQSSAQSYLGLTDDDFSTDAYRRYGVSALDNIVTAHEQQILRYQFDITQTLSIKATLYNNEHERDWFKTEGVDFDGSTSAEVMSRTSWFNVIQAANVDESLGGLSAAQLQGLLDGTLDTPEGSIQLRSNARTYFSRGVQVELDLQVEVGSVHHDVTFGLRLHEDEEDRLQRNSSYHQQAGALVLDDVGLLGNAGNRVQQAEALALHLHDRITFGKWVLTPGVRHENIDQNRVRYEIRSGRTLTPESRASSNIRDQRQNKTRVWLPGIGVLYAVNNNLTAVGGVHKGFTAPSNAPGVNEETAINWELGLRHFSPRFSTELMLFYSDYDNLLGECTASSGSDCTVGDAFNGDAASVFGVEFAIAGNLYESVNFTVPLSFNYTYINSEFDSNIADTDFFGSVSKGDPIPYIPDNQFNLNVGLLGNRWSTNLSATYVDEVCVRASCNTLEKTDSSLTVDVSAHYDVNESTGVFAKIENLFEDKNIMGRHPYGARPNKDRTATIGVRFNF